MTRKQIHTKFLELNWTAEECKNGSDAVVAGQMLIADVLMDIRESMEELNRRLGAAEIAKRYKSKAD